MASSSVAVFLVAFRLEAALPQLRAHLGLDVPEFADVLVEIGALALQIGDVELAAAQQFAQLLQAGAVDLVEVEQFADL